MSVRCRIRSRPLLNCAALTTACAALLSGCGLVPGSAKASDEPITVMTWAPRDTDATNMPGMPAMARAYARWINAEGGVDGRPLKVLTCNDHNDTVGAAHCATRASREDAVAVVGSYSQHGRSFMSALESAGIPYIGGYGVAEEELSSPLSYPVNGGMPALLAGNGRQLTAGDCGRVSLVRPDTTAGDQFPELLNAGLAAGSTEPAADVSAPEDAASYSAPAERALREAGAPSTDGDGSTESEAGGGADGDAEGKPCVTAVLGGRTGTFFDSFRRLEPESPTVRTASVLGSVRQSLIDRSGGENSPLEGAYATSWYPSADDERWKPMKRVIDRHAFGDNRIDPADPGVQTTWIAYTVLRQVLQSLADEDTEPSARSVRRELDHGGPVVTGGLTPELSWRFDNMLAARDFPRIVNANVTYQRVRDGRLVSVHDDFVDVKETLEGQRRER